MTVSDPAPKPTPIPKSPVARKPSAKTLARQLAAYLKANKITGDTPVKGVMDRLKDSIVTEEVGVNLDVWGEGS